MQLVAKTTVKLQSAAAQFTGKARESSIAAHTLNIQTADGNRREVRGRYSVGEGCTMTNNILHLNHESDKEGGGGGWK